MMTVKRIEKLSPGKPVTSRDPRKAIAVAGFIFMGRRQLHVTDLGRRLLGLLEVR